MTEDHTLPPFQVVSNITSSRNMCLVAKRYMKNKNVLESAQNIKYVWYPQTGWNHTLKLKMIHCDHQLNKIAKVSIHLNCRRIKAGMRWIRWRPKRQTHVMLHTIQQPLLIPVIPSLFRPWLWYKSIRGNRRECWEAIWGKQSVDVFAYRASCTVYAVLAPSQPPELTAHIVEVLGPHIFIQGITGWEIN